MDVVRIFDRTRLRKHRDRAAAQFDQADFLFREAAERLCDRLADVTRDFPLALDLGCHTGQVADALQGRGGIKTLIQTDLSPEMAKIAGKNGHPTFVADEEWLPFAPDSFDLVLSCLSLHWVNDLPGTLKQIHSILKPDGLFLAVLLGGQTLTELRQVLQKAEIELEGGLSPRVSPMAEVKDMGALLQRAGFSLPVADADQIDVAYRNPMTLLSDLRQMGETNAVAEAKRPLRRETLMRAMADYTQNFQNADGHFPATFEIITITGWKPHPSQPQPLKPGSGQQFLGDVLGDKSSKGQH